jgi:hypothetical protein
VYSVRAEGGRVTAAPHDSVSDWLSRKTGADAPERPPGL